MTGGVGGVKHALGRAGVCPASRINRRNSRGWMSWPYCAPATLPGLFGDPYAFEIGQLPDRLTFTYEKDDIVRTAWLEGNGHPEPAVGAFFVHGYATGRYEGNELVVETRKFTF